MHAVVILPANLKALHSFSYAIAATFFCAAGIVQTLFLLQAHFLELYLFCVYLGVHVQIKIAGEVMNQMFIGRFPYFI